MDSCDAHPEHDSGHTGRWTEDVIHSAINLGRRWMMGSERAEQGTEQRESEGRQHGDPHPHNPTLTEGMTQVYIIHANSTRLAEATANSHNSLMEVLDTMSWPWKDFGAIQRPDERSVPEDHNERAPTYDVTRPDGQPTTHPPRHPQGHLWNEEAKHPRTSTWFDNLPHARRQPDGGHGGRWRVPLSGPRRLPH